MIDATNGLQGIIAADTAISMVDGENGRLVYRGHSAQQLALNHSFEEVAHLLWYGHLPSESELFALSEKLDAARQLPEYVVRIIKSLPKSADMMSVLRTAVSAMDATSWPPSVNDAIRFTAAFPVIIACRSASLSGLPTPAPKSDLGHVANYLYMLTGRLPDIAHVRALEAYLILAMEHGMNASTFAGRVAGSTEADLACSLTASLGAMKGPLHGGAPSQVMSMLEEIGSVERAEPWLRSALESGKKLMGFGHRVYRTADPRARALKTVVSHHAGDDELFRLATEVEDIATRLLSEYKPGRHLYANVEFWAAVVLQAIYLPKPLYTPTFSVGRVVGWTAHALEQSSNNRIIRPQSRYVGPLPDAVE